MSDPVPSAEPDANAFTTSIYAQVVGILLKGQSVLVKATAGAGKTSLVVHCLIELLRHLYTGSIQIVAFNVAARDELIGRAALVAKADRLMIDTIQSVLEAAFRHFHPDLRKVSPPQRDDLIERCLMAQGAQVAADPQVTKRLRKLLEGLIRTPPEAGSLDQKVLDALAAERGRRGLYDNVDVEAWIARDPGEVVDYLRRVRKLSVLFVDEAQDLSRLEWSVVTACIEAGIVVLAVGDTDQTINVFRGADASGMERLIAEHAVEVDLPITWRAKASLASDLASLRAGLFPGSPDLVAARPGGLGARAMIHLGAEERAGRTVRAALVAEVTSAFGMPIPSWAIEGLPGGYDRSFLDQLPGYGLSDIAVLVATNKEGAEVAELLKGTGLPVVHLKKRPPDPLAGSGARILLSALDPWGETSDYPDLCRSLYLRCLLEELAERDGTRLSRGSGAGRRLRSFLVDLAEHEKDGREALVKMTYGWLNSLAEIRLGEEARLYAKAARRVVDVVFGSGDADPETHARCVLDEIAAAYDLYYRGGSEAYAVVEYALSLGGDRLSMARGVRYWPARSKGNSLPPLADGERRVVVAVVNQAKGLTFEATWVCALKAWRFPHRGKDCHEERCRYWVACTRATDLLVVHLHESDRTYPELGGEVSVVGGRPSLRPARPRRVAGVAGQGRPRKTRR